MPVQPRPSDTFSRQNLLLGFSIMEFEPALTAGGYGAVVPFGILSAQALQKEIETIVLERGDSGTLTVDREIVSRLQPSFQVQTFNFRSDLAQYIWGSESIAAVVADAAAAGTSLVTIPTTNPYTSFLGLSHANIDESTVEVTCTEIVSEAVGTGDGVSGGTQGDFSLDFKIKAIGDVTEFLVGGVDQTANLVAGSTPAAGEIAIEIGLEDSLTTGSGAITFGAAQIPANGAAIVATYTPSFSTTAGDIVNGGLPASADNDFVFDPLLGRIRFLREGADDTPFRVAGGQPLTVGYNYQRNASVTLKPFTQPQSDGRMTVRHLPNYGVNFIYTIPSVTLLLTDDELTFGAEDLATATLNVNINDAGGSDRFGTLQWSSETEANA